MNKNTSKLILCFFSDPLRSKLYYNSTDNFDMLADTCEWAKLMTIMDSFSLQSSNCVTFLIDNILNQLSSSKDNEDRVSM